MRMFRQENLGDVLNDLDAGPVVLVNRGQPKAVVMSADEFRRLKAAAGESVPAAAMPRQPRVVRKPEDIP